MKTTLPLFVTAFMFAALVACGGDKDKAPLVLEDTSAADGGTTVAATTPNADRAPTPLAATSDASAPTPTGSENRVASGEHCCVGSQYFLCPDANACFESSAVDGKDDPFPPDGIGQCFEACKGENPNGDGQEECFAACVKGNGVPADGAGGQTSRPPRCVANVPPPAGVDCAAGKMNPNKG